MNKNAQPTYPSTRVLVVEDSDIAAHIAKVLLEAKGCIVDIATTGAEALQLLDHHYHFIILDVGLPDMDGLEIARFIRSQKSHIARVPIIALSAHANDEKNNKLAKEIGLNGFLCKPMTPALCDTLLLRFVQMPIDYGYFIEK